MTASMIRVQGTSMGLRIEDTQYRTWNFYLMWLSARVVRVDILVYKYLCVFPLC